MLSTLCSDGLRIYQIKENQSLAEIKHEPTGIKCLSVSKSGTVLGYADENKVVLLDLVTLAPVTDILIENAQRIVLSPHGKIVFIYKNFRVDKDNPSGTPNVFIYSVTDGTLLKQYICQRSDVWQPQWNLDSSLCAMWISGEIHIYENDQFNEKASSRLSLAGIRHFLLCGHSTPNIAAYIPGQKGQPSQVRIYQWKNKLLSCIANIPFYRADTVKLLWNDHGTELLILTSTKLSDENYYGDQGLFYMSAKRAGDSAIVTLPRKGPIYEIAWRPNNDSIIKSGSKKFEELFVVCYGFVPASVTIFGLDCEPRFDFGTGPWNQLLFNPHGNLLLFAGLGNLPGDMCVWDFDRREKLSEFKTSDVTNVSWLFDGEHLVFATTTPRLRVNNGLGIWHYGGKQITYQKVALRAVPRKATPDLPAATEHELYQVCSIPSSKVTPIPKPKKFDCAQVGQNSMGDKPAAVYVPPALRNRSVPAQQSVGLETTKKKRKQRKPNNSLQAANQLNPENSHSNNPPKVPTSKDQNRVNQQFKKVNQTEAQVSGKKIPSNQSEKPAEADIREELTRLNFNT